MQLLRINNTLQQLAKVSQRGLMGSRQLFAHFSHKHALIILYDKCNLAFETTTRFGLVDFWEGCGEPLQLSFRLSPFAVHWPLRGRPITEVRSSGCKISQSQALCLFALFWVSPFRHCMAGWDRYTSVWIWNPSVFSGQGYILGVPRTFFFSKIVGLCF